MEIVANIMHLRSQPKDTHTKKIQLNEKSEKTCLIRPLRIAARRANELICVVKIVKDIKEIKETFFINILSRVEFFLFFFFNLN